MNTEQRIEAREARERAALTPSPDTLTPLEGELVRALERIENESVFSQQRYAEDTDTEYFLRCFAAVKNVARAALAKARVQSPEAE